MQELGGWSSDYFSCFSSNHNSPPSGAVPDAFCSPSLAQSLPPSDEVSTMCPRLQEKNMTHTHTLLTSASKQSDSACCIISCPDQMVPVHFRPLLSSQRFCSNKYFSVRDSFVLFLALLVGVWIIQKTKQNNKAKILSLIARALYSLSLQLLFKARLYRKLQKNSFLHFLQYKLPPFTTAQKLINCYSWASGGYNPATVLSEFFRLFYGLFLLILSVALNSLTLFSLVCLFSLLLCFLS